jgi:hypothetical protein
MAANSGWQENVSHFTIKTRMICQKLPDESVSPAIHFKKLTSILGHGDQFYGGRKNFLPQEKILC